MCVCVCEKEFLSGDGCSGGNADRFSHLLFVEREESMLYTEKKNPGVPFM